jgi:hypothetical protein
MKSQAWFDRLCFICGASKYIEQNHAGGRKHIPWFKVPFCQRHHDQFHRLLESVGINLRYTPNKMKRLVTAALALNIAQWMVQQALAQEISALPDQDDSPKRKP